MCVCVCVCVRARARGKSAVKAGSASSWVEDVGLEGLGLRVDVLVASTHTISVNATTTLNP